MGQLALLKLFQETLQALQGCSERLQGNFPKVKRMKVEEKERFDKAFGVTSKADPTTTQMEEEVKQYANAGDPFLWWKNQQADFPVLSSMAKDLLAIPAISTPSERVFSKADHIIDKSRSTLSEKEMRAC
eukprot:TRINITY_DN7778_c1_g1_i10.p2 TRINITY_DN7778_c1_g1~~TRINITY_DN7778_c1_g1_i10.p2  ORF type:complete len:130 (+),score=0.79 TRINITY_DN7778_c1_g1_i10:279-668(+)